MGSSFVLSEVFEATFCHDLSRFSMSPTVAARVAALSQEIQNLKIT